jgi:glyoxylase-like metal-dependent hydrolase (beta-lactamase superfamily II)
MKIRKFGLLVILLGVTTVISGQNWHSVTELAPKTWVIDDHGADNIYLLEGSEKALLIDTGLGAADLVSTVKKLTGKPVLVVNTHGHPDHSGANYQFDKIFMQQADIEAAKMFSTAEMRKNAGGSMLNGQKPADSEIYKVQEKNPVYEAVTDGFEFDLGDRIIKVMETPGHTPGSICLLDVKNKLLFSGDNNNTLVWLFLENCRPLSEYLITLENQAAQLDRFTTLYPGHGPAMESSFVKDQVGCVKSIISRTCESQPYESFAGNAKVCSFGNAMVAYNPDNL